MNIQLEKTVLLIYSHTWIQSVSSRKWDFGTWLVTQSELLLCNMPINIWKTEALFGSLAAEVNHRSDQNPLPARQWNWPSFMPFIFIVFLSSLCMIILPNFPFFILFYSKFYLSILIYFLPTTPSTGWGEKYIYRSEKKSILWKGIVNSNSLSIMKHSRRKWGR